MEKSAKIYVAGHRGMVGSAIVRRLEQGGYTSIIVRTHKELDLTRQEATEKFLIEEQPDYIFFAAAKVGGILANDTKRAEYIYENIAMAANVIHGAHKAGIDRLLFLGSSCIYPRDAAQPLREEYLLTGPLEQTNEPYAIAKIAGLKLCESYNRQYGRKYLSAMPTNLYGPGDNYDLNSSHVLPALIRKAHGAKESGSNHLELWGTGTPCREFLYSDDIADACIFLMEKEVREGLYNIGVGEDVTIADLARLVMDVVGLDAELRFDTSKPDGTPRKLLNVDRMTALGWRAQTSLKDGIAKAYQDFLGTHGG